MLLTFDTTSPPSNNTATENSTGLENFNPSTPFVKCHRERTDVYRISTEDRLTEADDPASAAYCASKQSNPVSPHFQRIILSTFVLAVHIGYISCIGCVPNVMLRPLGVFVPAELLLSRECCKAGDLIEIDRKLYAHWVVYLGDNEVVHVPETAERKAVVERCSLESVAQDCLVRINNKQVPAKERSLTELPRDEVVTNSINCVGTTVRCNFVVSNSEHFVTRLKYGVGWSDQAKAMRHSMSSLSPTPSCPKQVEQAHRDIWSEIHTILSSSPPVSPSSSPSPSL